MCNPILLTVGATAVTMAGQFMQGQSAYTSAKYEEAGAKANQALAAQQAKDQITLTEQEAGRRYRAGADLEGQQRAAMGANNIDSTFGSAASVQRDTKMITAEDVGSIYTSGERKTEGYLTDAYNYRLKAQAAKSQASSARIATGLGLLGTALGGASQVGKIKAAQNFGGG